MMGNLDSKTKIVAMMTVKVMILFEMKSKKVIQFAPLLPLFEMKSKLLNLLRLIEYLNFFDQNQHHEIVSCLN